MKIAQLSKDGEDFYPVIGSEGLANVIPVLKGGTGANNADDARTNLNAVGFDDTSTFIQALIANEVHEYSSSGTTTSTSVYDDAYGMRRIFTSEGTGVCLFSCSLYTDTTSDYGSFKAQIMKNGTTVSRNQWRWDTAQANMLGVSNSIALKLTQGDTVSLLVGSSKTGTKTCLFRAISIGCTLTMTS